MPYTSSEYNPILIKNEGATIITGDKKTPGDYVFIDPNPNQEIVPHEDLFIYVDLQAEARPKSLLVEKDSQLFKISNTPGNTVSLTTPQTSVTVDGKKLFRNADNLTTSWTEIGGLKSSIKTGFDTEGFNITNIDINIKSQVAPTVVVDFVDVRGATLFEQGSCSPYGFFFQLPYPLFKLTIKGYYGKAATYHLNLIKFNAKFNSETGNMECRAEFVGYSFAFLSDVLIGYVYAAGFLDQVSTKYSFDGKLKKIYENTVNFYNSSAGGNLKVSNVFCSGPNGCLKIPDLLKSLNAFDKTDKQKIIDSPEYQEVVKLKLLLNNYNTYKLNIENLLNNTEFQPYKNNKKIIFGKDAAGKTVIENFIKAGAIIDQNFNQKSGLLLLSIKDILTNPIRPSDIKCLVDNPSTDFDPNKSPAPTIYSTLYNMLNTKPWFGGTGGMDTLGYTSTDVSSSTYYIDFSFILENIIAEIKTLEDLVKKKTETVSAIIDKLIGERLGFSPTIRNVFTIFLANTEALMEVLKNVSVEAENYHKTENLTLYKKEGSTEKVENSNNNYVYSWPTYSVEESSSNGEAEYEKYPGEKAEFRTWPEVIFVEDFTKAFLKVQQFEDLLNSNFDGKVGYDNFAPINPLESPAWYEGTPNKYKDVVGTADLYKVIGERLFIALDHSLFQPVRLTKDAELIGWGQKTGIGRGKWNPILEQNVDANPSVVKLIAELDSWNLLNSSEDKNLLRTSVKTQPTATDFINTIITNLSGIKTSLTGNDIKRYQVVGSDNSGFKIADTYYSYMTDPVNGIEIKKDTDGNSIWVHPNPYKMEDSLNLIKIIDPLETTARDINLTNQKFKDFLNNTYKVNLEKSVNDLDIKTTDFDPKLSIFGFDDKQQMILCEKPQLFSTLAMSYDSGSDTWWLTGGDFTTQTNKTNGGDIVSNMGLITYWDDSAFSTGFNNGVLGVNLLNPYSTGFDIEIETTNDGKTKEKVKLNNIFSPLISTPMWLDNVIDFRKKQISPANAEKNYSTDMQYKNLAYLFLHTLKSAPLIQRLIDDDGRFFYIKNFTSEPKEVSPKDYGPSMMWSLRAFNTIGGITKVPKAWLLTLGAQLWRWREFTGSQSGLPWKKPLRCVDCIKYTPVAGNDPLIQPGYNSYDGNKRNPTSFRNDIEEYLKSVYGTASSYNTKIPYSCFDSNTVNTDITFPAYNGVDINTEGLGPANEDFVYFNYLNERYGDLYNLLKSNAKVGSLGTVLSTEKINKTYSWPQVYIAPHHIPYVIPDKFNDGDNGEGADFIFVTDDWIGYQDYLTIMPRNYSNEGYNEEDGSNANGYTHRSKYEDGNLGMVIQYLPDKVKDEIVQKFEDWATGDWAKTLLPIVDPIWFGQPTDNILTSYSYLSGKESPMIMITEGTLGDKKLMLSLNPNDKLKNLLTEKYWILNSTPKIWYGIGDPKTNPVGSDTLGANNFYEDGFVVSKKQFETYLTAFYDSYNLNLDNRIKELEDVNKDQSKSKNPTEDNDLKLALYRSFKSLNEKWLQRTPNGKDLFFNIAGSSNGVTCKNGAGPKTTLASHFVYVNRIWGDIGNLSVIDITKTNEIKDNKKMSLYQILSDILTDNEYLFFPLPTYVNLTGSQGQQPEELIKMFKPILTLEDASCGPLFVCMYVGGTSRRLDLSIGETNCARDNEDVIETLKNTRDDSYSLQDRNLPKDIQSGNFTAFKVLYGKQNQNHFKNIQLDQSEFTETAESLNVIDRLAQNQGSDRTTKGQSLMPAYLTRSYTCTIEAMGNVMIQPMTYFDLQGVPMFSGAYLITEVSHNVKPNNMSTTFKGVRQPRTIVPIVTSASATMNFSFTEESNRVGASLLSLELGSGSGRTYRPGKCGTQNGYSTVTNTTSITARGPLPVIKSLGAPTIKKPNPVKNNLSKCSVYISNSYGPNSCNNPGNLRGNAYGAIGIVASAKVGSFGVYDDIIYGTQASLQFLRSVIGNKKGIGDAYLGSRNTLMSILLSYATPNENCTNNYINSVGNNLKKASPSLTWVTLQNIDDNLVTDFNSSPERFDYWDPKTGGGYTLLKKYATNSGGVNTRFIPGDVTKGYGGTDIYEEFKIYNGVTNANLVKGFIAAIFQKEFGGGFVANSFTDKQLYELWEGKYNGDTNSLTNFDNTLSFNNQNYLLAYTLKNNINYFTSVPDFKKWTDKWCSGSDSYKCGK